MIRDSRPASLVPPPAPRVAIPPHFIADDDVLGKAYDPRITRRLLTYVAPHRRAIGLALVYMFAGTLGTLSGPYLIKVALDNGIAAGDGATLAWAVGGYLAANVVLWLTMRARIVLMAETGQKIIFALRARLFEHLQTLALSFYSRYSVGRLLSRVVGDVGVLREMITWAIVAVANDLITLVGLCVAMLALNWRLSLLTFLVLPLMAVITARWRAHARESYRDVRRTVSWMNGVLNENIQGVRVVQSYSREDRNYDDFVNTVNRTNLDANVHATRVAAYFFPTIDFLGVLAVGLVVWIGGVLILQGGADTSLTPGVLVAFVLYIDQFFNPIRDLSQRYNTFQATMAAGERIFELLDTPADIVDQPDARELPVIDGAVRFEGVGFSYPDAPEIPVLQDIDLDAQPGQMIALVGATGAGKSTLVRLIGRFYEIGAGRLTIDGVDVRDVTLASLRRQMGVVLQTPFLFDGSVGDNIRYGRPGATDEDVVAAARAVGAHDFIMRMAQGYNTPVEEGGAVLSAGQRQLISFARALLANPRILILDEATSSVDTQTERIIQSALERLLAGRTSFVIAHRLSTVVQADRIVVLDHGRVVEQGSHADLLARRGRYYQLYTMAFAGEPGAASRE
jgi:ATP-binding cassette subfamily B multidrug efflux pump